MSFSALNLLYENASDCVDIESDTKETDYVNSKYKLEANILRNKLHLFLNESLDMDDHHQLSNYFNWVINETSKINNSDSTKAITEAENELNKTKELLKSSKLKGNKYTVKANKNGSGIVMKNGRAITTVSNISDIVESSSKIEKSVDKLDASSKRIADITNESLNTVSDYAKKANQLPKDIEDNVYDSMNSIAESTVDSTEILDKKTKSKVKTQLSKLLSSENSAQASRLLQENIQSAINDPEPVVEYVENIDLIQVMEKNVNAELRLMHNMKNTMKKSTESFAKINIKEAYYLNDNGEAINELFDITRLNAKKAVVLLTDAAKFTLDNIRNTLNTFSDVIKKRSKARNKLLHRLTSPILESNADPFLMNLYLVEASIFGQELNVESIFDDDNIRGMNRSEWADLSIESMRITDEAYYKLMRYKYVSEYCLMQEGAGKEAFIALEADFTEKIKAAFTKMSEWVSNIFGKFIQKFKSLAIADKKYLEANKDIILNKAPLTAHIYKIDVVKGLARIGGNDIQSADLVTKLKNIVQNNNQEQLPEAEKGAAMNANQGAIFAEVVKSLPEGNTVEIKTEDTPATWFKRYYRAAEFDDVKFTPTQETMKQMYDWLYNSDQTLNNVTSERSTFDATSKQISDITSDAEKAKAPGAGDTGKETAALNSTQQQATPAEAFIFKDNLRQFLNEAPTDIGSQADLNAERQSVKGVASTDPFKNGNEAIKVGSAIFAAKLTAIEFFRSNISAIIKNHVKDYTGTNANTTNNNTAQQTATATPAAAPANTAPATATPAAAPAQGQP